MTAALIVLAIAGVDCLGWAIHRVVPARRRWTASLVAVSVWVLLVAGGGLLLGLPLYAAAIVVAIGLVWAPATSAAPPVTLGIIAAIAAVAWLAGPSELPVAHIVAVIAVALFLGLSANIVCRAALEAARRSDRPDAHAAPDRRIRALLERRWSPPPRRDSEMRGGRLIGPLERWLIVALALIGAQGIIAALMAAKGIVRFPEISKNAGEGSKAEEFLVGSLMSWGLAGAGALLIWSLSAH